MSKLQKYRKLRLLFPGVFLILVLAGLAPAVGAQSATPEGRITDAVDERQLIELKDQVNRRVRSAMPAGAAHGDMAMERMMLLLGSSPAQQESLEQLLAAQQDPASSNYHRWLTPQEFGEQFGPAPQDVETVTAWLRSHGLHATVTSDKTSVCPPMETDYRLPLVQKFLHTARQKRPAGVDDFCDASILAQGGIPSIVFGPGDIAQAHTADEWISQKSLEAASALLYQFFRTLP